MDQINWAHTNSHQKDAVPLPEHTQEDGPTEGVGVRHSGKVLLADERCFEYWNHNPFRLNAGGAGNVLFDSAAFPLPCYMGLYHGFVRS